MNFMFHDIFITLNRAFLSFPCNSIVCPANCQGGRLIEVVGLGYREELLPPHYHIIAAAAVFHL